MKRIISGLLFVVCILMAASLSAQENTQVETLVLMETSMGKIKVKLFNDTPLHRDNFIKNVQEKTYNGTVFHRVIKQFMVQGGGIAEKKEAPKKGKKGAVAASASANESESAVETDTEQVAEATTDDATEAAAEAVAESDTESLADTDALTGATPLQEAAAERTIPAEIIYPKYFHKQGMLCAARTGDDVNPEKASSAIQFYIVTGKYFTDMELNKLEEANGITLTPEQRQAYMLEGGSPHLDGSYTVYGEVVDGMKVVDKIQFVTTGEADRPVKDVVIKSMTIVKK